MISHYARTAIRYAVRHRQYTGINIIGLAISFACCLLICLWLLYEMSYDKHYAEFQTIHEILAQDGSLSTPHALAPYLQEQVPEIQWAARITGTMEALVSSEYLNSFENILPADPAAVNIFSFPFIAGNPATAMADPNSIIITEKMASKFFPHTSALGETLTLDGRKEYLVTGVIENIPHNATLQFDIMIPIDYIRQPFLKSGLDFDSWQFWGARTFVKAQPGVTASALTDKIAGLAADRYENREVTLAAVNIGDVYMRFFAARKDMNIFLAVAIAILVTACINFINLSTAGYRARIKEVGIRKTIGAGRSGLVMQFMGESMLLVITGFILALILVEIALPQFNSFFHTRLSLGLLNAFPVIAATAGVILFTGLAAGFYPSLVLSGSHPAQVLKNGPGSAGDKLTLRRILVVLQFTLSAIIIIGSTTVYNQVHYLKTRDVGYSKEQVVNIRLRGESADKYGAVKNELIQNPDILAVTGATGILPYWDLSTTAQWAGMEPDGEEDVNINFVDYDFIGTFGITLIEGRDFDAGVGADRQSGCLVNESLARMMGQTPVLGSRLNIWDADRQVIGIMKDFNFRPLHAAVGPLALIMNPDDKSMLSKINYLSIRVRPDNLPATLEYMENAWNRVVPGHPFEYSFLDENFDAEYASMDKLRNVTGSFGTLAIFIACLGLFGVASLSAGQRTKEMGIRKVLGASIPGIVSLISREYVILVGISNLIAWPVAWYMMHRWLNDFAYHIDFGIGTLLGTGIITVLVALFTVGFKALQVARTNPVDAIKYE